jgi:hypothetical protein
VIQERLCLAKGALRRMNPECAMEAHLSAPTTSLFT